jgi:hypothetical protein
MFNYTILKVNPVIKNAVKIKKDYNGNSAVKRALKRAIPPSKVKSANYFRKVFKILTGCCAFCLFHQNLMAATCTCCGNEVVAAVDLFWKVSSPSAY